EKEENDPHVDDSNESINGWNSEMEILLLQWRQECLIRSNLHRIASNIFNRRQKIISVPLVLFSAIHLFSLSSNMVVTQTEDTNDETWIKNFYSWFPIFQFISGVFALGITGLRELFSWNLLSKDH